MDKIVPTDFVIKAVAWIVGEVGSSYYANDPEEVARLRLLESKHKKMDYWRNDEARFF